MDKAYPKVLNKVITPGEAAYHHVVYDPLESHPDWNNLTGAEDSTFYMVDGTIWARQTNNNAADQLIGYQNISALDVRLTGRLFGIAEGGQNENYIMTARMIDYENYIGLTLWQNDLRVYERVAGSWDIRIESTLTTQAAHGKVITLEVIGTTITLTVEGEGQWTGTAAGAVAGPAGMISREWLLPTSPLLKDFAIENLD
jgi:hypothetical protein